MQNSAFKIPENTPLTNLSVFKLLNYKPNQTENQLKM